MKKTIKLEKNSYLCTMKPFRGMKMMKHVALLAVLAVPATGLMAQNEGVGVNFTPATFQVHSYTELEDYFAPVPHPTGGGGNDINSGGITPIDDEHHYLTTLLITNTNTGLDDVSVILSGNRACRPILATYQDNSESILDTGNVDCPCGIKYKDNQ